jgi:hypothetical protein
MSVRLFKNDCKSFPFILHGNDTDVTCMTIVKIASDVFVITEYFIDDEVFTSKHVTTRVQTKSELCALFTLQYDASMQFISEEDFNKFINQ